MMTPAERARVQMARDANERHRLETMARLWVTQYQLASVLQWLALIAAPIVGLLHNWTAAGMVAAFSWIMHKSKPPPNDELDRYTGRD